MRTVLAYLVGYGLSVVVGHWLVARLAEVTREPLKVTRLQMAAPLGVVERAGYTTALALGQPAFVGAWLVIKTLGVGTWNSAAPKERAPYQRSLVLTLVSLGWGVVGWRAIVWIEAGGPSWRQVFALVGASLATLALERWIVGWVLPGVGARAGLSAARTDARNSARAARDALRKWRVRRLDS
jgi:hypothetical protein